MAHGDIARKLLNVIESRRRLGNTTTLLECPKVALGQARMIVAYQDEASRLRPQAPKAVALGALDSLRGTTEPIVIDLAAVYVALRDALEGCVREEPEGVTAVRKLQEAAGALASVDHGSPDEFLDKLDTLETNLKAVKSMWSATSKAQGEAAELVQDKYHAIKAHDLGTYDVGTGKVGTTPWSVVKILVRPYGRVLTPDRKGGYTATIQEFPGCVAEGDTADQALVNLEGAAGTWIEAALDQGYEILPPGGTPAKKPTAKKKPAR